MTVKKQMPQTTTRPVEKSNSWMMLKLEQSIELMRVKVLMEVHLMDLSLKKLIKKIAYLKIIPKALL